MSSRENHFTESQLTSYLQTLQFHLLSHLEISGSIFSLANLASLKNFILESKVETLVLNRDNLTDEHLKIISDMFLVQQTPFDKKKKATVFSNASCVQVVSGQIIYHIANGYLKNVNLAWNLITDQGRNSLAVVLGSISDVFGAPVNVRT